MKIPSPTSAGLFKTAIFGLMAFSCLRIAAQDDGATLLGSMGDIPELLGSITQATAAAALPDQIVGKAQVYDGDTFDLIYVAPIAGRYSTLSRIRLDGVDACESRQSATFEGVKWPCGAVATGWLVARTIGKEVRCHPTRMDRYGRFLSQCYVGGEDIGAMGIREGMMVVYRYKGDPTVPEYEAFQAEAKTAKRGLWSSEFTDPQKFRKENGSYNPFEPNK